MRRILYLAVMLSAVSLLSFGQFNIAHNASNTPGVRSSFAQVAFGPDGVLHIVWGEDQGASLSNVFYTNWDGTTMATPIQISQATDEQCYFPFVATNGKGMIAIIWAQNHTHWLAVFDPETKQWQEPEQVSGESFGGGYDCRPKVGLDQDNNIFCYIGAKALYQSYARCKIDGVWEDMFLLSPPGFPCKEGGVCVTPEGVAWTVYGVKEDDGDYKPHYRTRTKDTEWTEDTAVPGIKGSQGKAYIAVGLNGIPYLCLQHVTTHEGANNIIVVKMDGDEFPQEVATDISAYHYPRVTTDNEGYVWLASQFGQGDHGLGITYWDNTTGEWQANGILPDSSGEPKMPGIAADAYGNVAISYDPLVNGVRESIFSTRYPVEPKHFYPPINTKVTVSVSGIMTGSPQIEFGLSWQKNPDNNDTYLRGYKIFKKEGSGDWEELTEVTKDTLSYEIAYSSALTQKIQFAISAVSAAGFEGDRKVFGAE